MIEVNPNAIKVDEPEKLKSNYRQAADKTDWINLNSEVLEVTPYELGVWLRDHGQDVDLRGLRGNPNRMKKSESVIFPESIANRGLMLTGKEVEIIKTYMADYDSTFDSGSTADIDVMTACDRLATALRVVIMIAEARGL